MPFSPSPDEITTASPEALVLMLFEGAVRFGREAQEAIAAGDRAAAAVLVGRVRAIVQELDRSLNPDAGSVTRHLGAIYEYVLRRLEPRTVDAATIGEVIADLAVLCEAWTALVVERRAGSSEGHAARHAPALA
jgi:flagellar secretion chaperone FliS